MDYEVLSGGGAAVTDPMKIQKLYASGAPPQASTRPAPRGPAGRTLPSLYAPTSLVNTVTAPSSACLTLSMAPCRRHRRRRRRRRARGELLRGVRTHLADGQPVAGTVPAKAAVQPLDGPRLRLGRQRGHVPLAAGPAAAHAAVREHGQNGRLGSALAFAGKNGLEAARRTA